MNDLGMRIDPMGLEYDELSFRADAVLPAQFYSLRRGSTEAEPIKRLMARILIDAVRCFQRNLEAHCPSRGQEFKEAEFWLFDDNGNGPFSFQSVCDLLEIDAHGLRNSIVRWKKNRICRDKRMTRRSPVNNAIRMQSPGGMPKKPYASRLGITKTLRQKREGLTRPLFTWSQPLETRT